MAAFSIFFPRLVSRNVTLVSRISNASVPNSVIRGVSLVVPKLSFSTSGATATRSKKEWFEVTYEKVDGTKFTVKGKEGDNLLDIAINNDLDLDGYGACEGTLACSTCHLIFKKEDFDVIEDPCTDEELDMLDLAYGLTDTSRLGCQVCLTKKLNGTTVKVPEGTADARSM